MNRSTLLAIAIWFALPGFLRAALNVQITNTASSGGSFAAGVWTPTASPSRINVTDLLNQLNAGNVTVNTNVAGAEAGDITVSSTVSLDLLTTTSARTLTLRAVDDVIISAAISQSGGGTTNTVTLNLTADFDNSGVGGVTVSGDLNSGGGDVSAAGAGFTMTAGRSIATGGGIFSVSSTGGFSLGGTSVTSSGGGVSVSSTGAGTVACDITSSGGNITVSAGGNLTVNAGADLNASGGAGTGTVTTRSLGGLLDFFGTIAGGFSNAHVMSGVTGVLFQGGSTVNVGRLDVDATGTGNIEIRNLANMTLTQSATFDTQNGDILLVAGANFTPTVSTSLAMQARGPAGDVSIADPILLDDAGATLTITAQADVVASASITTTNAAISLTGRNITASAGINSNGGNVSLAAAAGNVSLSGAATQTGGGTFTLNSTSFAIGAPITTSGGNFNATTSGAGTLTNDITTSGGNLTVTCAGSFTVTTGSDMNASGGAGTGQVNARSTGGVFDFSGGIAGGGVTQVLAGGTGLIIRSAINVPRIDLDVLGTGDFDLRAGASLTVSTSLGLDTANGDVLLNGTTNFGASGSATTITARGSGGDIQVNAGLTCGTGGLTLRADNDVVVGATITNNGSPIVLRSDLDNNGTGQVSTTIGIGTGGGTLTVQGATFSLGGPISTVGALFSLNTTGGGSFANDITTSGGDISVTTGGSISTSAGADLDASGGAGVGTMSLVSTAGQVTIGGTLRTSGGGDVIVSGNTGVIFNGDITGARNVDVDCVTGNIALNATASIVNSGTSIAFDAANSTVTTAAGAIITPGVNSKLHMQARTGANNLTVTMPLSAGSGGLELLSDNNVVINSAVSSTGPVTVRGDVNGGGVGAVNATASITSSGKDITIEGKGVTVAAVTTAAANISILNQGTTLNLNGNISNDGGFVTVDSTASPVFAAGITFAMGSGGNALYITTRSATLTIPAGINITSADEIGFNATGAGADMVINLAIAAGSVGATFVADDTLTVNAPFTGTGSVEYNAVNGALAINAGATVNSFNFATFFGTGIAISAAVNSHGGSINVTNDGPTLALNSNLTTDGGDLTVTTGVGPAFPIAPAAPVWSLGGAGVARIEAVGDILLPSNLAINDALMLTLTTTGSSSDVTFKQALNVGVGGITVNTTDQLNVDAALTSTGAIFLRADSNADNLGVLLVSAPVTGGTQPVTLRGAGVAVLANVDTTTGEIRIEPGAGNSANIAALLLSPSRLINGTTAFTVGNVTGNPLTVNSGATLSFDNATRAISPSAYTQTSPLGETRIRIAGTSLGQFNRITSTGAFNAGGRLTVQFDGGFTPATGASFDLFNFTTFTGGFASYTLPALAANQAWDTSQIPVNGTLRVLTHIQLWRQQYFGTIANTGNAADGFDANNDGELNLMEFATAQNPNAATHVAPTLVKNGANLEFTYTRSNAALADGATFTVEWSDTLTPGSWSSTGVTAQILGDNGTVQTIKATVAAGPGPRFMRLRVVK